MPDRSPRAAVRPRSLGPSARAARSTCGALVLLGLAACGGGNAQIVDAQRRFERCYGLDEDAEASEGAKLACWQEWSAHDGARADMDATRVHYARERLRVHASVSAEPVAAPIVGVSPAASPIGSARRGR